mmetsp:Transcript_17391/g.40380  ORF Transcript_17391/g.40380 Transcript_17391/m.40380 type:complete len:275 (-) Transcript_17391:208-1032(-)
MISRFDDELVEDDVPTQQQQKPIRNGGTHQAPVSAPKQPQQPRRAPPQRQHPQSPQHQGNIPPSQRQQQQQQQQKGPMVGPQRMQPPSQRSPQGQQPLSYRGGGPPPDSPQRRVAPSRQSPPPPPQPPQQQHVPGQRPRPQGPPVAARVHGQGSPANVIHPTTSRWRQSAAPQGQQQQQQQQQEFPKEETEGLAKKRAFMVPMTREQYEAQQSVIREVYDPESGRMRLVRGTGEIIERIVSRQDHDHINQIATRGDGASFSRHIFRKQMGGNNR